MIVYCQMMADLVGTVQLMFSKGAVHRDISWSNVISKRHKQELCLLDVECGREMEGAPSSCRFEQTGHVDCMAIDCMKILDAQSRDDKAVDDRHHARFELESILYLFILRLHEHLPQSIERLVENGLAKALEGLNLETAWNRKENLNFDKMKSRLIKMKTEGECFTEIIKLFGSLHEMRLAGLTSSEEYLYDRKSSHQWDEQAQTELLIELNSKERFMTLSTKLKQAFLAYVNSSSRP